VNGERAEFVPLRPRRLQRAAAVEQTQVEIAEPVSQLAPVEPADVGVERASVAALPDSAAPPGDADEPADARADELGEEQFAAAVREEAIRFAAIAVARALREHLRDPAVLTAYVDDALRACGREERHVVRLHPDDAMAYRAPRGVEVIADPERARGEVSVAASGGEIGATIEERAELLARAAAHA